MPGTNDRTRDQGNGLTTTTTAEPTESEREVAETGGLFGRALRSGRAAVGRAGVLMQRMRNPLPDAVPYVKGETPLRRVLFPPALLGFVGCVLIFWGASQPTSPFTLNYFTLRQEHMVYLPTAPTWFFGVGPPGRNDIFFGVVAVYGGMVLMFSAWLKLFRLTRMYTGIPVARIVPVLVAWLVPLLVVAPLFSHDAYSYVGQGEQMTRHVSPYLYGPYTLGSGGNPYADYTDPIWLNVTSPYGPVFLTFGDIIMRLGNHSYLGGLVGFRLLAVLGMVMLAVFLPRLARSYGLDPTRAFVLGVLNPLLLLHLVGGAHNDSLMMGLLIAGLALAAERRPVLGIIVCSLGALVKVPALIGVAYIGWDWLGGDLTWRQRIRPILKAGAVSFVVLVLVSELLSVATGVSLGFGWVSALSNPGTVRSWMDPATGVADLVSHIVSGLGFGGHGHVIITIFRGIGGLAAIVICLRMLRGARGGISSLKAIGVSMLAVVLLGPVVQPWYLVWGIVLLAPLAVGRIRTVVIGLSIVSSFLGLPGGRALLGQIGHTNPLVLALFCALLVGVGAIPLVPRVRRLVRAPEEPALASQS